MQKYVVVHFDNEEAYQKKIGYPEYKEHHHIHEEFKLEVSKYVERFEKEGYIGFV